MKNFQKISKELNEAVKASDWNNKLKLKVEHTAFNPLHRVASGRNGVSKMLDLQTVLTEATETFFETDAKSSSVDVYINSRVEVEHRFGRYSGIFLRLKDARGKYHSLTTKNAWEAKEIQVDNLVRIFSVEKLCDFEANSFAEYCENERAKVVSLFDKESVESDPDWAQRTASETLRREYAKELLQDLVRHDLDSNNAERFEKLCTHAGVTIVRIFHFTQRFSIFHIDFVNVSDKSIEIGWTASNTYNSLPETLKITLVKEIKAVSLSDLGIEGAGYYSHDDSMTIPADQVERAKAFARRFASSKNKGLTKLLKAA